ncbi:hypothetical protein [Alteribacillus sp. HJP-4]|uniref:hypothetical protein n=1 Tax=Alteribacillus sp. HJP-4 TaxID=2775394 RepID=UPI0035CCF8A3
MIKKVYIYVVLFATLMMVIGGSVGVFSAVSDLIAPAPYYQSFEDYTRMYEVDRTGENEDSSKTTEELRKEYDEIAAYEKERMQQQAKNSLMKSFAWIVVPLPVFIYFQRRLLKKEDQ